MAMPNNYFPVGYQYMNPYQGQVQMPMQNTQQQSSGIIWVQGEAGAKSYLVAPNTTVQLWDSENEIIYLKSADASGMPSMKILDYKVRGAEVPRTPISDSNMNFATKDDLESFRLELNTLKQRVEKILEGEN